MADPVLTARFDFSRLKILEDRPWRWTDGTQTAKQTLNGVFIMLSDELVTYLRSTMTQAEKDEVAAWVNRYTEAQAAEWHSPMWAGQTSAVYWRIPAAIWNDPTGAPPLKVRNYFRDLYRT